MKGRSHRPQSSDPPDDWVDGSWTVDCVCGVTFDDGEEMVKCDECGVWVHTRCSRYVKGDDTFSCDKCKSKSKSKTTSSNNNSNNNRVDRITEETEVAQLLIELPTKTMSMEKNHHNLHHNSNNSSFSASKVVASRSRRPFKLWAEKPMEEKVHVQGIPGGDPSLFAGKAVPSIFGPQLWKCTGYVPKKFNFQYREFPYWDDEKKNEGAQENDNGAGVLFSFSKETSAIMNSPVAALVDMRSSHGKAGSFKDMGMGKFGRGEDAPRVQSAMKKESGWLRPLVVHSSKKRKEDFGNFNSKDKSGKKRVRTSDKDVDPRRRSSHSSKPAFPPTRDAKQMEFYEDRGPKILKADTRSLKNKNLKDKVVQEHISNDFTVDTIVEEPSNNLTATEESSEALYPKMARRSLSDGDALAEEKTGHKSVEMSSKTDDAVTSALKHNCVEIASVKEKD